MHCMRWRANANAICKVGRHNVVSSTTADAKTVPLEFALSPVLNVVSVVDVSFFFTLLVYIDVIKDIVTDVIMNKVADHANITTVIATMVEEIVHEDVKKALKVNVIADMAEDVVDEAVGQYGVDNDDRHAAGEEIVVTADENVVEHVLHITTYK